MEEVLEILRGLHPEVDYETCETLIDDKIIDSFDIVTLISDLSDEFDITIPVEEIKPENFNSAKALYAMVERLLEDE
ncbi:MAG TPA: acyl carrier protein [Lachnospiraceae bacterium]|jgi:acyl carrier protein|nr:acyl carrier protein [Lachnospiraceae bacterium]HCA70430.1 acyl carrier protein [Lachnospiraceae bacterium]HCM13023.1 acyl carrier protein [Lachnospiraceae bacterium]HCR39755.1 acyl carrier protein [Lachnospiraceae bacterium]